MTVQQPSPTSPRIDPDEFHITRAQVEQETVSYFRRGWSTLPDIRLVRHNDVQVVVKDWRPRSALRRTLQGRPMLAREATFLRHLDGIPGVPRFLCFPDADSLAIEFLKGRPISDVHPGDDPRTFFDRLTNIVNALHERGVTHGDLDQDDNIMVLTNGHPAIIDFGGAMRRSRFGSPADIWYDVLRCHDLWCIYRLRLRFELDTQPAPPSVSLRPWQRKLLIAFRKMERHEPRRMHGRGEAPV